MTFNVTFDWEDVSALHLVTCVLGVLFSVNVLLYAFMLNMSRLRYSNIFLGLGLGLFFIRSSKKILADGATSEDEGSGLSSGTFAVDTPILSSTRLAAVFYFVLGVLALLCSAYIHLNYDRLLDTAPIVGYTVTDQIVGALILFLVVESTRKAYGWAITGVALLAIIYAFGGQQFPGIFRHSGMDPESIIISTTIGLKGVYGFILGVGSTWIAIFIIFAGMAKSFGLLDYILDVGSDVSGLFRSGIVQVALVSSLIIGSITGSAAANTATTGSFTIPLMKEQGVRKEFAAAIESVASSGGQIMPPVMGVAAFLMADILGISYVRVIEAALLPALLFYGSVALTTHLLVLKFGWTVDKGVRWDRRLLTEGIHFVIPLATLIYTLVILRYSPLTAGLYSILVLVATTITRNLLLNRGEIEEIANSARQTTAGLIEGAAEMAPLVGVLGSMGIIVGIITETGLSQKISTRLIGLAGGVFLTILILAMITSILFGLGMPTPAAYILVVILVAPGLIEAGVRDITAHMFVFYFAMLSAITPPVAISVAIACRIADSKFLNTAVEALRIGLPAFLIPFIFIANDSLIYWSSARTLPTLALVTVGLVSVSISLSGYSGRREILAPTRALLFALAFVILFAPYRMQLGGAIFALTAIVLINLRTSFVTDFISVRMK